MTINPFKASYPNKDLLASPDSFFNTVSKEYANYKHAGFFKASHQKALYIYQISGTKTYTGIIASNDIIDLTNHKILGHEHTINEKEQEMLRLILHRKAMIKPVLLAYHGHESINHFITTYVSKNEPFFEIALDANHEKHSLWEVNNASDIAFIQTLFAHHVPNAYIADGHHRAAITSRLVQKNYLTDHEDIVHPGLLCAFFPFDDLSIFDFSRIVDFSNKMTATKLIARLSKYFEFVPLTEAKKPDQKHHLSLYLQHEWYLLQWRPFVINTHQNDVVILDVDLFNQYILREILDINDIKSSKEVKYLEGIVPIQELMSMVKESGTAGFCFFPVTKEDVILTADAKEVLPPKSTWFEPRMKNGLVIKEF